MTTFALALLVLAGGGVCALLARSRRRLSAALGVGGAVAGCALGAASAVPVLLGAPAETFRRPWGAPWGDVVLTLDAVSAAFLVPLFVLSALAAVYGLGYLHDEPGPRLGAHWLGFDLFVACMALVFVAANGALFLLAWEGMSLAAFFLVGHEHRQSRSARSAAWTFFVASHLGTAFLVAFFVLLAAHTGSFELVPGQAAGLPVAALLLLALVGFGTKAGLVPLHVWLPEAHPAAPSHVSAVMSGVMIKTGIYGLLRVTLLLAPPPPWWGWLLLALGVTSGLVGALFALAQHELKRLLAYCSVENVGVIAVGLGLGALGQGAGSPGLAVLGYGGALLHVVNHAALKGLLFLGAGSVLHATGAREFDHLGGLLRRMPLTGTSFLLGAAAISGLPPLNGFASEFLLYLGAYRADARLGGGHALVLACAVITGLALVGGLAAAGFAKAFGITFLGEPRSEAASRAHEVGILLRLPPLALAAACVAIGLAPGLALQALGAAVAQAAGLSPAAAEQALGSALPALRGVTVGALALLALVLFLALVRHQLLRGREVAVSGTWDCGYARPTARMQYTASSFAQPITDFFESTLRTRKRLVPPHGYFARAASIATETPDVSRDALFHPLFTGVGAALRPLRALQHGHLHLYVLNIALVLAALLVWQLL